MASKAKKKRTSQPRARLTPSGRRRARVTSQEPTSISASFDDAHDPDRCASCQWRAENVPDALLFHDGELVHMELSSIPRVAVRVQAVGLGPGCGELEVGVILTVPDGAPLGGVLEVIFLERPHLEVPDFALELRVNGALVGEHYTVSTGDDIRIRRFADA